MKNDYLKEPVRTLDLEKIETISELLRAFNWTSFQSRTLARCADIFVAMLEAPERSTIFLGMAGAMVPAGMKGVVSTMIRRDMIDVIVSTGANMYHDFVEALGEHHYLGSPDADDRILREEAIDRIYDTYADESKFRMIDNKIMLLADKLAEQNISAVSSRFFLNHLGEIIDKEGSVGDKKDSIIWNCWKNDVPIFVPALSDSSLGLAYAGLGLNEAAVREGANAVALLPVSRDAVYGLPYLWDMAAIYAIMKHAGFIVGGAIAIAVVSSLMGDLRKHPVRLAAISLIVPVAIYYTFKKFFYVFLP